MNPGRRHEPGPAPGPTKMSALRACETRDGLMILQQLTLRDFGLFRGKQVLDLSPGAANGRSRPIVLFGGVNGAGKTTILDAIQLVLYGGRPRGSKAANMGAQE